MKRHYPEQPLVGVGGVVFRGEEVLVVRRGQEPARDAWSLPGGVVELGETLEAALVREIKEETGLAVKVLGVGAVLNRIYRDEAGAVPYHYVLIDYICEYVEGELRPASDITDARFVSREELAGMDLPRFTADVIRRAYDQRKTGSFLPILG